MKFGVPRHMKGVRPEAWEAAREAARRSGMSVGEWLDNAINDSTRDDGFEPPRHGRVPEEEPEERPTRARRPRPPEDEDHYREPEPRPRARQPEDEDHYQQPEPRPRARLPEEEDHYQQPEPRPRRRPDEGRRYSGYEDDPAPPPPPSLRRRKYSDYDDRHRPAPDESLIEVNERLDALSRQLEDQQRHLPAGLAEVSDRLDGLRHELDDQRRRAPQEGIAEINDRLDWLSRQLDLIAQANSDAAQQVASAPEDAGPHHLVDAITRLDQRLDQLIEEGRTATTFIEERVNAVDRAVADLTRERPAPPLPNPASPLDQALVEIAERQRALDQAGGAPPSYGSRADLLPRAPTQGLSGLERQLRHITERVETLHPDSLERAVETLRNDLAEIGLMLKEAMPRRAIEALETEVRTLAQRVDSKRHAVGDNPSLTSIEHGLAEVRDALRTLAPAESLVGLDDAVRSLTQRIEQSSVTTQDPVAIEQLEGAIVGLRGVVSHVASNEALAKLSEDVRSLTGKVDQMAHSAGNADMFSTIEHRIAEIADALQSRTHGGADARALEEVVHGLNDKLERLQMSRGDHAAVGHLEDRIVKLVEKLDASDARLNHLEAIERGLAELLIHLEHQRVPQVGRIGGDEEPAVGSLKQDISRTQDSLEAVHGTLGHVVDRLAQIETNLRQPASPALPPSPASLFPSAATGPAASALNAALGMPQAATISPAASARPKLQPATPPVARPAAAKTEPSGPPTQANPAPIAVEDRHPIDPSLPPDHPLEPGAVRGRSTPSERIAASEAALAGAKPPVIPDPGGKSNFIAAARRAAQAALTSEPAKADKHTAAAAVASAGPGISERMKKHLRPLLVGHSGGDRGAGLPAPDQPARLIRGTDRGQPAGAALDAAGGTAARRSPDAARCSSPSFSAGTGPASGTAGPPVGIASGWDCARVLGSHQQPALSGPAAAPGGSGSAPAACCRPTDARSYRVGPSARAGKPTATG